jgi:hypothetical protein
MIDLKAIYESLPETKYDHKKPKGFYETKRRSYRAVPNAFGNKIENQTDIDRFGGALSSYSSKFNDDDQPLAVITSAKLDEDHVPIKIS